MSRVRFLVIALACGTTFAKPALAQTPSPAPTPAPAQRPAGTQPSTPTPAPAPTPGPRPPAAPTPTITPTQQPAVAQQPATPKKPATSQRPALARRPAGETDSDLMRCWWDTDKRAVHIGEQFTLKITCSVIETERNKVVPAPNQFEPTAVQIAPYEVLGGMRHDDILAPPWRYFQHEYTLRLIGDKYFGQDVDIPSIKIGYNIQSASAGGAEGRDLTYTMPPLPVRIMSLVPKLAADIRDAPRETFADIESRRFRSTAEIAVAVLCFGFALVLVGLALVRTIGRYSKRVPATARPLPARAVLSGCVRRLARLKGEVARSGWTPELAGRALTAFRIAGAVALGRPVAQRIVDKHVAETPGQIAISRGGWRGKRALVSAPTTVNLIDRHRATGNGGATSARPDATLEQIRESIRVFNAAHYGRDQSVDRQALDLALGDGARAIRRLRVRKLWPERSAGTLTKSAAAL